MKTKLNIITLALLANTSFAVMAGGYDIANANTSKVKFDKWVCKGCKVETGYTGQVGAGIGYNSESDLKSANAFGSENELAGKLDADIRYQSKTGYAANIEAHNLGLDNGRLDINVGKASEYNLNVNYRSLASYQSNTALSPYSGIGGDNLTLPSNWVYAATTAGMTELPSSVNPIELKQQRQRTGLGLEYQATSMVSTFINFQREEKTGTKQASGSIHDRSMMIAEPVDYTTDTLDAGIKLRGEHWFTSLNYSGSFFKNNYNEVSFDSAFLPTFGGDTRGYLSLDPDNEAHTVSLAGRYKEDATTVSGRLMLGKLTQDQDFSTSGYGYQLPAQSLDASVDLTSMSLKVNHRYNRDLRLSASYDYSDRDNNTQVQQWTQISINDVNGTAAYNTPYDSTNQRVKLAANYRLSRDLKLDGGYDFKRDERSYQDRETTDENNLWARLRVTTFDQWDMWVKGSYGQRDGSQYQSSQWTSAEQNKLLRKYYLADRNRTQIEARFNHNPIDNLNIDFGARYAKDDYNNTQIGLTDSDDSAYDINLYYAFTKDISANTFYSYQTINSNQAGSSNGVTPNWYSNVEDEVNVAGVGVMYDNLLDSKMRLGLDYSFSRSDSSTKVIQGITGDYGNYYAKAHNINAYATYQATPKLGLRFDYIMENYVDNDPSNSIDQTNIDNVLTFGSLNHDYNAHMVMLSFSYKL
ncbi:MtrB/PioB family decaheme-associated outer membrane protein [Shewanella intestini]|uniref:MtrB/PioB family decaheme-associated outer membrane protein n=1 Tax=Shewanella intestini TaxID=2017544 RepID=A0ABS5I8A5_9GAMM|nr:MULTISPECIES: MtrB/PioB family decaheme-associated outer membrane protein [Shewanella]MBR9729550.1 MtrB/PioB family decaheme-associated outer membrane protein [Shewanella intestini]MRG35454.1 MtrB/PioB family decaheme-associated outer membrane protein [Shewanella sp. XMDDZSB0408]